MNNDLISREALRKAFHERIWYFTKSSWDEANALIDSAPTVDITEQEENAYNEGYAHGLETKRTQGEWIEHSCYKDVIICSNCNSGDNRWHKDFKFCPNCGADMRGYNHDVQ